MTLPTTPEVGELVITEVLAEYDGPRLFIAENPRGEQFLVNFVDETDFSETYLAVRLSELRVAAMRSGRIAVRQAFTDPEPRLGLVVRLEIGLGDDNNTWQVVRPVDIPAEWLPHPDVRLDLPTPTARAFLAGEIARDAVAFLRPTAAFEFDLPERTTQFPLRALGALLTAIQDNVDAQAQEAAGTPTTRGPIPQGITQAVELSFTGVRAASFVLLVAPSPQGLFASPLVEQALRRVQGLIDAAQDDVTLVRVLRALGPRSISKYREFLEQVDDIGVGITMLTSDIRGELHTARMNAVEVRRSLLASLGEGTAETETLAVEGVLIGVNARTHVFEIYDDISSAKISGKMIDAARSKALGLTTGARYRASVVRQAEFDSVTSEIKYKHLMTDIHPG